MLTAFAPPSSVEPVTPGDELSLSALLDLFEPERPGAVPPSERSSAAVLRAWMQDWVRRATEWGAGPGGAWRAW